MVSQYKLVILKATVTQNLQLNFWISFFNVMQKCFMDEAEENIWITLITYYFPPSWSIFPIQRVSVGNLEYKCDILYFPLKPKFIQTQKTATNMAGESLLKGILIWYLHWKYKHHLIYKKHLICFSYFWILNFTFLATSPTQWNNANTLVSTIIWLKDFDNPFLFFTLGCQK